MIEGPRPWQGGAEIDEEKAWTMGYGRKPPEPQHIGLVQLTSWKEEKLHQLRRRTIDKTDILIHEPEPEESGDEDWIVDEMARPALSGSYSISKDAWGDIQHEPEHDNHSGEEFLKKRIPYHYITADGQPETIDCSILDRVMGHINEPGDLPKELSYPALCSPTFDHFPTITKELGYSPDKIKAALDRFVAREKKIFDWLISAHPVFGHTMLDESAWKNAPSRKTIEKAQKGHPVPWGCLIPPDPKVIFSDTPIGKLFEDHPGEGFKALWAISKHLRAINPPTKMNMVTMFMFEGSSHASATAQLKNLITSGVLIDLSWLSNKGGCCYLNARCYQCETAFCYER